MGYFSENLKAARMASGLKQDEVAALIGASRTNYNDAENGRKPLSLEKMQKLAEIPELGLTLAQLKAWKVMDEYEPEVLQEAIKLYKKIKMAE